MSVLASLLNNDTLTTGTQTLTGVKTFSSVPISADGYSLISGYSEIDYQDTTITTAQLLALNATPITVVAAPGASKAVIPLGMVLYHAGGTAYAGIAAGEDLVLKYTNGSGVQCSGQVETTGFLDQTTTQTRYVGPFASVSAVADITPVANAVVVLHLLTAEITTGNFALLVRVFYKVIPTVLS